MRFGCIGKTLKHSFSAEIHPFLSEEPYELVELTEEEMGAFLTEHDFLGINVTIPYKQAVIPYLHEIDGNAQRIGAVNTVVNRNGRLYGYNTDFFGMLFLLELITGDLERLKGKKVAILGTGGTSLTAKAVVQALGCGEILCVSRTSKENCVTYEELYEQHRDIQLLINTTPVGMYPKADAVPVDPADFPRLEAVADAIYNPLRTELILRARECGIPAEGGLVMLVAQAVRAAEIFHNCHYPPETVEKIVNRLMRKKENIVLIGMPGSGKTTVGQLLAQALERPLCDMDEEIKKADSRPPSEILDREGETFFRDLESRVLREQIAHRIGEVIATGGGAVLRAENVRMLKRNGRLYFLNRPLSSLIPTEDRPLSSTVELLEKRYRERYSVYCSAADVTVEDPETAEIAKSAIVKEFLKQSMKLYVLNGPNLNMLGIREPQQYGSRTYSDLIAMIQAHCAKNGIEVVCKQSNHEGDLVDWIQEAYFEGVDGIVINPGAYTHTSIAILDAVKAVSIPTVEVHISKIEDREAFRQISYIREACVLHITGHGFDGYLEAIDHLKSLREATV